MKRQILLSTIGCFIAFETQAQYVRPQLRLGAGWQLQAGSISTTSGILLRADFALPTSGNRCQRNNVHCFDPNLSRFIFLAVESSVALSADESNFLEHIQSARIRLVPIDINLNPRNRRGRLGTGFASYGEWQRLSLQVLPADFEFSESMGNTVRNSLYAAGIHYQTRSYTGQYLGFILDVAGRLLGYRVQSDLANRAEGRQVDHSFEILRGSILAGLMIAPSRSVGFELSAGYEGGIASNALADGTAVFRFGVDWTRYARLGAEGRISVLNTITNNGATIQRQTFNELNITLTIQTD